MTVASLKVKSVPYTYVLEWTKQGKRYIGARWAAGCHPSDLWNDYFTSSRYVDEFVKSFGPPDVILIDQTFDTPYAAMTREQELQKHFDIKNNDTFLNKAIAGVFDFNDPQIREKMREARIGKKHTEEHKRKIGAASKNVVRTKEWCERISQAQKGKKRTPEQIENIKKSKLRNTNRRGTKTSAEGIENMRLAKLGQKHSEHTKTKMSEQRQGQLIGRQNPVCCPKCGKIGAEFAMKRWHFDNCKYKTGE